MTPARIMGRRKRSEHYVNNKEFLAALIKLREDREIAEIQGKEKPTYTKIHWRMFLEDCYSSIFQTKLCKLHV